MSPDAPSDFKSRVFMLGICDISAGIMVWEEGAYRFCSTDTRFDLLDGSRFKHVHQAAVSAFRVLRASLPPGSELARNCEGILWP